MAKGPIIIKAEKRQLMHSPKLGVLPFTKAEYEAKLREAGVTGGKKSKAKPKGKK